MQLPYDIQLILQLLVNSGSIAEWRYSILAMKLIPTGDLISVDFVVMFLERGIYAEKPET